MAVSVSLITTSTSRRLPFFLPTLYEATRLGLVQREVVKLRAPPNIVFVVLILVTLTDSSERWPLNKFMKSSLGGTTVVSLTLCGSLLPIFITHLVL
jgi:hypothetical protein